jgi:hypothetical protein
MTTATDASALLESLNPEQIVDRLQALDRESRALRVLLRASRIRQRDRQAKLSAGQGGRDAG